MSSLNPTPTPPRTGILAQSSNAATVTTALAGLVFALLMLVPLWLGVCACTMFTLSATLLILATSLGVGTTAFGALTIEREKKTLDCLRLTQLTADQVLLGKIAPEMTRLATVLAVLSPTVVAVGLLGDESYGRIFGTLVIALLAGLFSTTGGLLVSSLCETTSQAVVSGWIVRGVWLLLTPVLDFVAGAVFVQSNAPPIFTSVNPLAAFAALDVPEAVSGIRPWLPAIYVGATLLSCAIFWRFAARRFDNGLASGGGLRDTHLHATWQGRGPVALARAIPGLADNPSFLRELASQMRAGAGRWPGYLVFVVLFLAPAFYAHCWTLNDLRHGHLRERAGEASVTSTAGLPETTGASFGPTTKSGSSLALVIPAHGSETSQTVVVVKGHTSTLCMRLALYRGLGIPMPEASLRFYTMRSCSDGELGTISREQQLRPGHDDRLHLSPERQPDAVTARILGLETTPSSDEVPSGALAASAQRAALHVGLAGAIALLLLYLCIRFSAFLATAVTGEKARRTWEDLALTGISAKEAVAGKVGGAMILPLLQMTVVFPLLGLFVVSGNLTVPEVLGLYAYTVALSLTAAMLGLWASATRPTSHEAHLRALCIVLGAFLVLPLLMPLMVPLMSPLALLMAITNSRRPIDSMAWFCVSLALWMTPIAATPLTAAVSFMPSLTSSPSFLRSLGGGPLNVGFATFHLMGGLMLLLSVAVLLREAAMRRLSNEHSEAITTEAETGASALA